MDKTKVAIIGAGFIADRHAAAFPELPDIEVIAVADVNLEKAKALAEKFGARAYNSLDELLGSEKPDSLDICLPTTLHKDAAIAGMKAGIDVLVEKPFATTLSDCDEMIKCSEQTGRKLMVAQVCRFRPEYIYLKKLIESGEMGKPLFFTANRISLTPTWSFNNWLQSKKLSGGTIMDLSIHDIDVSNWLFGKPESVFARETMIPGREGPSHVFSVINYESGMISAIEASHLMPPTYPFSSSFRLVLEKGSIEMKFVENVSLSIKRFDENGAEDLTEVIAQRSAANSYGVEIKHFADVLKTNIPLHVTPESARLSIETILLLTNSMEKGQVQQFQ